MILRNQFPCEIRVDKKVVKLTNEMNIIVAETKFASREAKMFPSKFRNI
jgi:hypothetical protein